MSWLLGMTGMVIRTPSAATPIPLSISRPPSSTPEGQCRPAATAATVCTCTTAPAPVKDAIRACKAASADGRWPPAATARPSASTTTTSAPVSSPLSRPLAVTARRNGSLESTSDTFPDVPRIQPNEANLAAAAASASPAALTARAAAPSSPVALTSAIVTPGGSGWRRFAGPGSQPVEVGKQGVNLAARRYAHPSLRVMEEADRGEVRLRASVEPVGRGLRHSGEVARLGEERVDVARDVQVEGPGAPGDEPDLVIVAMGVLVDEHGTDFFRLR